MPRPPRPNLACASALILFALTGIACDEPMGSPSTLEGAQILAIKFTPRVLQPGETQKVEVLGHAMSGAPITMEGCILPWTPEESGVRCAAEDVPDLPEYLQSAIPLGSSSEDTPYEASFALPEIPLPSCEVDADCYGFGTCVDGSCPIRLWIRFDDEPEGGALNTIAQISTGELIDNPEVTALALGSDKEPLPESVQVGEELEVVPELTDPNGEGGRVVTYFTSAGSFSPWRTNEGGPSTWTAPEEPGEVTWSVVVRDPGGGVGWMTHTFTVTEAP